MQDVFVFAILRYACGLSPNNQAYQSHTEGVFILVEDDVGFVGTSGPCKRN